MFSLSLVPRLHPYYRRSDNRIQIQILRPKNIRHKMAFSPIGAGSLTAVAVDQDIRRSS